MRAWTGPVCLAVLPMAVVPGLEHPFSTPKVAWLIVATLILLALRPLPHAASVSPVVRWTALAWMGSFLAAGIAAALPSFPALALGLAAPMLGLALVRDGCPPSRVIAAQVLGATTCAVVALGQWAGADPFAVSGWHAPIGGASIRMRVYGTLGNPNFVGVLMASSVPLALATISRASSVFGRRLAALALAIQAAALVATGSRGAVLGLATAVAVYAVLRWSRRVRIGLGAVAIFAIVAVVVSPARPIDTTAAGRLYLWRVVSPHAWDAPVAGLGPGAVERHFPGWQRGAAREGVRDRRFAGLTDHVHNDYLEALVERGVPGLVTLVAPLIALLVLVIRVPRPVTPELAGTTAAVAAGAACALVDFPLARPAELAVWWVAIALALQAASRSPKVPPEVIGHERHV
jgi:putative inorganic carbon (HCO3(-)) transporter